MSFGIILAFLVLIGVFIAIVFRAAAPDWLPMLFIGMLALALLMSDFRFPWKPA